jgi:PTH1 family peptidyl-tRNA hydrolase
MWLLVPLGNPGASYDMTRHNLGRLAFMRWVSVNVHRHLKVSRRLRSGDIYVLNNSLHVLIPNTYMNLSGLACSEAISAGYNLQSILVVYDDKDIPLGLGRLRLTGSDGGHKGLQSILECLRSQDVARLKLGIGPFQRPLVDFVLGQWTKDEINTIADVDSAFSRFMHLLQHTNNLDVLVGKVNAMAFWRQKVLL